MFALLLILVALALCGGNGGVLVCNESAKSPAHMDVFWVNLDRSVERKAFMHSHLGFYGLDIQNRVSAFTPDRVFIPDELAVPAECISFANQSIPNLPDLHGPENHSHPMAVLLSHCGRKKNRKREIAVTISHLHTIRRAIYTGNHSNPYALILEDDLQFATGIDFDGLISSAPGGFGVLQLITSNDYAVLELWRVYLRHKLLWVRRKDRDDYWCAGAYIINKAIWKPYIDQIFAPLSDGCFGVHLIAGYEKPECTPALCCERGKFSTDNPICIRAARGYASDNFLFNIPYGHAYMLTVPIVTGAAYGNASTLHQDHVSFHVSAFHRINSLVHEMTNGVSPMPRFMIKECVFNRSTIVPVISV